MFEPTESGILLYYIVVHFVDIFFSVGYSFDSNCIIS